jgi:hypothetical protein
MNYKPRETIVASKYRPVKCGESQQQTGGQLPFVEKMQEKYVESLKTGPRRLLRGEKHALQWNPKLGMVRGSFIGPGTQIVHRLKYGNPNLTEPISIPDKVAKAHDIRYALGKSKQDVRNADLKMIEALKRHKSKAYTMNRKIAELPIKAKMKAEDWGLDTSGIATFGKINPADRPMLERELRKLEQEGFGFVSTRIDAAVDKIADAIQASNFTIEDVYKVSEKAQYGGAKKEETRQEGAIMFRKFFVNPLPPGPWKTLSSGVADILDLFPRSRSELNLATLKKYSRMIKSSNPKTSAKGKRKMKAYFKKLKKQEGGASDELVETESHADPQRDLNILHLLEVMITRVEEQFHEPMMGEMARLENRTIAHIRSLYDLLRRQIQEQEEQEGGCICDARWPESDEQEGDGKKNYTSLKFESR